MDSILITYKKTLNLSPCSYNAIILVSYVETGGVSPGVSYVSSMNVDDVRRQVETGGVSPSMILD